MVARDITLEAEAPTGRMDLDTEDPDDLSLQKLLDSYSTLEADESANVLKQLAKFKGVNQTESQDGDGIDTVQSASHAAVTPGEQCEESQHDTNAVPKATTNKRKATNTAGRGRGAKKGTSQSKDIANSGASGRRGRGQAKAAAITVDDVEEDVSTSGAIAVDDVKDDHAKDTAVDHESTGLESLPPTKKARGRPKKNASAPDEGAPKSAPRARGRKRTLPTPENTSTTKVECPFEDEDTDSLVEALDEPSAVDGTDVEPTSSVKPQAVTDLESDVEDPPPAENQSKARSGKTTGVKRPRQKVPADTSAADEVDHDTIENLKGENDTGSDNKKAPRKPRAKSAKNAGEKSAQRSSGVPWTDDRKNLLRNLVVEYPGNWKKVAEEFNTHFGKTPHQLSVYYGNVLSKK
ncbi:hypothetical protein BC832DRAFT_9626 [Gaertneriomyces semiglobifer]|nr:hypothetical protein BC832DRAFT_9626 [Gaertneriomyces semiglobifer]